MIEYAVTKISLRDRERTDEILKEMGDDNYEIVYVVQHGQELVMFFQRERVVESKPAKKKAASKKEEPKEE
jgi:hypothetical protein